MLWQIGSGGLQLLGTCHALQASDYPIAEKWETAYRRSSRIVFEADPRDPEIATRGVGAGDNTLFSQAPELYDRIEHAIASQGYTFPDLATAKPWWAGVRLGITHVLKAGFEFGHALDTHLLQRAEADQKTTEFLETISQHFAPFESMPVARQLAALEFSLANREWSVQQLHRVVSSWRNSDEMDLASALQEYTKMFPELYQGLVPERNHNWLPRIEELSRDSSPTLLCVGALHLVGPNGLPTLLESQGVRTQREQ